MVNKQTSKWDKVKLGDIVSFKTGKLNSNAATSNGIYPFFTCSQETFRTDTYSFDTDCVLLGGNNANGIYPLKYFSGKFDAYQRTYIIRTLDKRNLSNRYLFFAFRLKLEMLKSISTGAATKFLTLTILKDIDFELPSLPTQHKIASILSAYDDLIENNTRRIQILEEMAQALYREWFVEFRFPGHEKVKMVESELGMVPEGWDVKKLGDIAKEIRRSVKPDQINPETPYVGLQHIPRKSIALSEWGMASEVKSTKLSFKVGEILFGKIRPYFHKVAVAPISGVCSSDTIVISSIDANLFSIVLACVSSDEFV
ncbi:MAG: restriction endonuclease subunit S, partial [Methanosarcinaceae archaeon]